MLFKHDDFELKPEIVLTNLITNIEINFICFGFAKNKKLQNKI